jgi:hypothetical protein
MTEPLVEATNKVEDEGAVSDHLAKRSEVVGHLFQLAAVGGDRKIALDEVAKLGLQVDGASLAVPKELRLNSNPGIMCCGTLGGDNLDQIVGEGGDDPGFDNAVHP